MGNSSKTSVIAANREKTGRETLSSSFASGQFRFQSGIKVCLTVKGPTLIGCLPRSYSPKARNPAAQYKHLVSTYQQSCWSPAEQPRWIKQDRVIGSSGHRIIGPSGQM